MTVKWHLIAVLIFIFLMTTNVEHRSIFSSAYWLFVYLPWRNTFFNPVLKLVCFFCFFVFFLVVVVLLSFSSLFWISSVQLLSHVRFFATLWTVAHQALLSITNSQSLLKFISIESVMPSDHLIPVIPFFSRLQYILASGSFPMSQFFCIRWPKCWSFSFSISPSNEYSGLISFRMDWLDLLASL